MRHAHWLVTRETFQQTLYALLRNIMHLINQHTVQQIVTALQHSLRDSNRTLLRTETWKPASFEGLLTLTQQHVLVY